VPKSTHKHAAQLEAMLIAMIHDAEQAESHDHAAELRTALTLLRPPHSDADAACAKILAAALRRAERDGVQHTEDAKRIAALVNKIPVKWQ
jgi:hypothetical protein